MFDAIVKSIITSPAFTTDSISLDFTIKGFLLPIEGEESISVPATILKSLSCFAIFIIALPILPHAPQTIMLDIPKPQFIIYNVYFKINNQQVLSTGKLILN